MVLDYQTFEIGEDFHISVDPSPREFELSDVDWEQIEICWEEEMKLKAPLLFNGKLLILKEFDSTHIQGSFIDYKLLIAQKKNPDLRKKLRIIPISLSGFTKAGHDLIFAMRAEKVSQYPLHYELAPSGGFDHATWKNGKVDIKAQFYKELEEELGVKPTKATVYPWKMVINEQKGLCEICVDCYLEETPILLHSEEYQHIQPIPLPEVPRFVAKNLKSFLPFSLHLLWMKGII